MCPRSANLPTDSRFVLTPRTYKILRTLFIALSEKLTLPLYNTWRVCLAAVLMLVIDEGKLSRKKLELPVTCELAQESRNKGSLSSRNAVIQASSAAYVSSLSDSSSTSKSMAA